MENTCPDAARGVETGLEQVDVLLQDVVSHDDPFIAEASAHLLNAGGKRFRPQLTLLVAHLGRGVTPEVVQAAAAVELVHLASLYHDDVMDEADLRRGVASANARFGTGTAVVVGDLLFGRSSELVSHLGPEAVRLQAQTFVRLCAGQIRDDRPVPEGVDPVEYLLGVLGDKTGILVSTAARYGAMFSGCDDATIELVGEYGQRLGVVFQLADDLLDVAAEAETSGKTPGTDLREGKATLPVLFARRSTDPEGARLRELLAGPVAEEDLDEALELLRAHPAMAEARAYTQEYARRTIELLEPLGEGEVPEALRDLVHAVADRVV
ncbi:heptaprenyl diphosphate synthase [Kytococcus aerolatus]|uniref:Heptaprenyl diphosphate synthase n=1 Tax=Kytococcus aerolatus TaxID=592308 RepID=A0A212TAF3_9MICO|nr:heptaprenyl diphosphate synthase [Kytococcus aerolatus]